MHQNASTEPAIGREISGFFQRKSWFYGKVLDGLLWLVVDSSLVYAYGFV